MQYRSSYAGDGINIPRYDSSAAMVAGETWELYFPVYTWNVSYKVEVIYDSMRMLWTLYLKVSQYHMKLNLTDELMVDTDVSELAWEVVDRASAQVEMPKEAKEYLRLLVERAFGLDTGR